MKSKSYLFLFFLIVLLFFVLGVRYGQKVEKNNKVIDYLLRLPSPTVPISPTPLPAEASAEAGPTYKEYKSKKWGLKFTYPANLEVKEDATAPAIFFELKK